MDKIVADFVATTERYPHVPPNAPDPYAADQEIVVLGLELAGYGPLGLRDFPVHRLRRVAGPPRTPARVVSTTSEAGDSSESIVHDVVVIGLPVAGSAKRWTVVMTSFSPSHAGARRLHLDAAAHHHGVLRLRAVERVDEFQRRLHVAAAEERVLDGQLLGVLRDGDRRAPAAAHVAAHRPRPRPGAPAAAAGGACAGSGSVVQRPEKSAGACRNAATSKSKIGIARAQSIRQSVNGQLVNRPIGQSVYRSTGAGAPTGWRHHSLGDYRFKRRCLGVAAPPLRAYSDQRSLRFSD